MNTDSKTLRVQRYLAKPNTYITVRLAARKFDLYSLTQRMGDLADRGFPVESEWVKTKTARFKRYWFNKKRGNS